MIEAGLPVEFRAFFDHAKRGVLAFPFCPDCQRFHWYPMPRCPHCQGAATEWRKVAGPARVFSYTNVEHAFDKRRRGRLPYIVALVTFEDAPGVRLVTNIVGAQPDTLAIDQVVEPVFPAPDDAQSLVLFRPAGPHAGARR